MTPALTLYHHPSPIGPLHLVHVRDLPVYIDFDTENWVQGLERYLVRHYGPMELHESTSGPTTLLKKLDRYFAGKRETFDIDLLLHGTEFQVAVWKAVARIPYGHTTTYGSIASAVGRPTAVRAAGTAIGANPLPIVIPCHRVVAGNGGLAGFGGGLERKKRLLELERVKSKE